jgi:hypothetical protein
MLLSAGGFAVYHAESNAFNLLGLRYGNLKYRRNRKKLLEAWLRSKLFLRTGLQAHDIEQQVLNNCRNAGDFLRIVMEAMARKQGVKRWAECTPLHLLYLPLIKKLIPEALIVHIIRDGRDVAVSLDKIGWIRPLPWDRERSLVAAGLFWKWIVSKGLQYGRNMGTDYLEVRYEDLVQQPRETLAELAEFLDHDLDYERIQKVALGSVRDPNSSFKGDGQEHNPVGRWKTILSSAEIAQLESAIDDLLVKLKYPPATPVVEMTRTGPVRRMCALYPTVFDTKLWLKSNTPLGRMADVGRMGQENRKIPGSSES